MPCFYGVGWIGKRATLDNLKQQFDRYCSRRLIELSAADLTGRWRSKISQAGWTTHYLFGNSASTSHVTGVSTRR
ncbi:MAG TPA: hypothetical protein DEP84_08575 [Chloroflexi bacterium]|nr:hypothetical protein [Chloroflexota bacterium]